MIAYLIKSGVCLALLLVIYKVILERERMYVFNRFYLIFGLCFSLLVPFITFETIVEIPVTQAVNSMNIDSAQSENQNTQIQAITDGIPSWIFVIASLYIIGFLAFSVRFVKNIIQIFYKIIKNTKAFYKKASLVLLKEITVPHTFLHYIFVQKDAYETQTIAEELYIHELAHVRQKHTLDILLIELIQIVFWFNPLLTFYKKAIQLNHEFLADDAVLKSNTQVPAYQQLLLENAHWNHNLYLASNLNFSVTKKRLQMMTKHTSKFRAWLCASLTIPMFIGALFLFSTKVIAHEMPTVHPSASTALQQDAKAAYYQYATFIFEDENGKKTTKKYAQLTAEEKAMLLPAPTKTIAKRPSNNLLNDWKNNEKFAIWIDGNVVDNSTIATVDIAHYVVSFVHKNARSKRFPQMYQVNLYTKKGFESTQHKLTEPLSKNTVLHFKKGKNGIFTSKRIGATPSKTSAREALATTNKLPFYQDNLPSGPQSFEIPQDDNFQQSKEKKDLVIWLFNNGKLRLNYKYSANLDNIEQYIQQELKNSTRKKAKTALIIYQDEKAEMVPSVKNMLQKYNIRDISVMKASDLPPPPPPPAPPKPEKVKIKEIKVKDKDKKKDKNNDKNKKKEKGKKKEKNKEKFDKKPVIIEVVDSLQISNVSEERAKDIIAMHQNISGHVLKTMTINGKSYYYVEKNGHKFIYNDKSQLVDEKGNVIQFSKKS